MPAEGNKLDRGQGAGLERGERNGAIEQPIREIAPWAGPLSVEVLLAWQALDLPSPCQPTPPRPYWKDDLLDRLLRPAIRFFCFWPSGLRHWSGTCCKSVNNEFRRSLEGRTLRLFFWSVPMEKSFHRVGNDMRKYHTKT